MKLNFKNTWVFRLVSYLAVISLGFGYLTPAIGSQARSTTKKIAKKKKYKYFRAKNFDDLEESQLMAELENVEEGISKSRKKVYSARVQEKRALVKKSGKAKTKFKTNAKSKTKLAKAAKNGNSKNSESLLKNKRHVKAKQPRKKIQRLVFKSLKPVENKDSSDQKKAFRSQPNEADVGEYSSSMKLVSVSSLKQSKKKLKKTTPSSWSLKLASEYYPETKLQEDGSLLYYFDLRYKPSSYHNFRFRQLAQQFVAPDDKKNDFELFDTRIYYSYWLSNPKSKGLEVRMHLEANLPTSKGSQDNGVNGLGTMGVDLANTFGDLWIEFRPYAGYYWTQYSTGANDQAMPLFRLGHYLTAVYSFTKKLTFAIEADTAFLFFQPDEISDTTTLAPSGTETQRQDSVGSSYFAGAELGYAFVPSFTFKVGYLQVDSLINNGRYGIDFLSKETSRYYVGAELYF